MMICLLACAMLGSLNVHYSIPTNNTDGTQTMTSSGYSAELGYKNVYAWGSYDKPGLRKYGQGLGGVELIGYGVGTRFAITEKATVHLQFGKFEADVNPVPHIAAEITRAELNHDHAYDSARVFDYAETYEYKISGAYGGRVAVDYEITPHFHARAGYRFLQLKESMNMWVGDCGRFPVPEGCSAWWQGVKGIGFGAAEIGIGITF